MTLVVRRLSSKVVPLAASSDALGPSENPGTYSGPDLGRQRDFPYSRPSHRRVCRDGTPRSHPPGVVTQRHPRLRALLGGPTVEEVHYELRVKRSARDGRPGTTGVTRSTRGDRG